MKERMTITVLIKLIFFFYINIFYLFITKIDYEYETHDPLQNNL